MLTGRQSSHAHDRKTLEPQYEETFLASLAEPDRGIAKRALRRMFPRLDAIWSNTWHGEGESWQRDRLICSPTNFRTYFAFGVTDEGITADESRSLIRNAGIVGATALKLREFLSSTRRKGGTRAALALEELTVRADDIAENDIARFLADVFSVADELDVPEDTKRAFAGLGSNNLRIHWLVNNLVLDRFDLETRSSLMRQAVPQSSLGWIVSLSDRCKASFEKESRNQGTSDEPLVDKGTAEQLWDLTLSRLRAAAKDGTLIAHRDLCSMLFRWKHRATPEEVEQWTKHQLAEDQFIIAMANDLVQASWSQGMGSTGFLGDRVARKADYVHLQPYGELMDLDAFRERVDSLLASERLSAAGRLVLTRFKSTPERDPSRVGSES